MLSSLLRSSADKIDSLNAGIQQRAVQVKSNAPLIISAKKVKLLKERISNLADQLTILNLKKDTNQPFLLTEDDFIRILTDHMIDLEYVINKIK